MSFAPRQDRPASPCDHPGDNLAHGAVDNMALRVDYATPGPPRRAGVLRRSVLLVHLTEPKVL
jgi:hypothetical protein